MLTNLDIHGLAIIEKLSLEFSATFNVITGETGTGKSILIKALSLLQGAKASSDVVRQGFSRAIVSGLFLVPSDHRAIKVLEELGIPFHIESKEVSICIRRQVSANGKSKAWINDSIVTYSVLRDLGYLLIDVFGQHENQRLLNPKEHLYYLDKFLDHQETKDSVKTIYEVISGQIALIKNRVEEFHTKMRDRDYLAFRLNEIESFDPDIDDYEKCFTLSKSASELMAGQDKIKEAQQLLDHGGRNGNSLADCLWQLAKKLDEIRCSADFVTMNREAAECAALLEDLSYRLDRALSGVEFDENELELSQQRIAKYQDLFRKLSVNHVVDLVNRWQELKKELDFLDQASAELKGYLEKLKELSLSVQAKAKKLTMERKKTALKVKRKIETELHELEMKGSLIEVEFFDIEKNLPSLDFSGLDFDLAEMWQQSSAILAGISANGAERAQFLLAANLGEPAKPLAKIASGGEISRIMLAIKSALAAGAETCVLVFDEIDAGISGRAADVVGRKMKELSRNYQIICISHLPQVAAYADFHLLVEKTKNNGRTESRIVELAENERAHEIARLLSGNEITKSSLDNARVLVDKACRTRIEAKAP